MLNNSITSGSPKIEVSNNWTKMREVVGEISWAWTDWLPNGFVVIVAANSGTGKSALVLRICGCFTNGLDWPDGTPFTGEQGSVLWCEGEAAQAINLDRAAKYNLNMDRFITPFNDPLKDIDLDNSEHIAQIREIAEHPDIKVIVIDSLRGVNSQDENSSNMNGVLNKLAKIARDTKIIIIITHHIRKKGITDGADVDLDRLRGSSAIAQAPRVIWAIDSPSITTEPKRLHVIKCNIGKYPPAIGFHIKENGIEFCDPPNAPEKIYQLEAAEELLLELLSEGPMKVTEIKGEFLDIGISWRTANTAKKKLGIESNKVGGKGGHSVWKLPLQGKQKEINTTDGV